MASAQPTRWERFKEWVHPTPRNQPLRVYYEPRRYVDVDLHGKSTAGNVCLFVTKQMNLENQSDFAIVDDMVCNNLKRSLEDHESILQVNHYHCNVGSHNRNGRLHFTTDVTKKYRYLKYSLDYFPSDMVVPVDYEGNAIRTSSDREKSLHMQSMLIESDKGPIVYGQMHLKDYKTCATWKQKYFVLRNKTLYVSESFPETYMIDTNAMQEYVVMESVDIYLLKKGLFGKIGFTRQMFCFALKEGGKSLKGRIYKFACTTDEIRYSWITALRIHKYGQRIREDYHAYENRNLARIHGTRDLERHVEDGIAHVAPKIFNGCLKDMYNASYVCQPWFQPNIAKLHAREILKNCKKTDGAFFLYPSLNPQVKFHLMFKDDCSKVHKLFIKQVDSQGNAHSDENQELFYKIKAKGIGPGTWPSANIFNDLTQLVEYIMLNSHGINCELKGYFGYRDPRNTDTLEALAK